MTITIFLLSFTMDSGGSKIQAVRKAEEIAEGFGGAGTVRPGKQQPGAGEGTICTVLPSEFAAVTSEG